MNEQQNKNGNEANIDHLPRSPLLMSRLDTAMLVVDIQDKLLKLIPDRQRMIWNVRRLLDAAKVCEVPVLATEQYPQALGGTEATLASRLSEIHDKTRFSCGGCPQIFDGLLERGIRKILVVGMETHVCILQTTLDLLTAGFDVYLPVDAIAARFPVDHRIGIRRMEMSGAVLTSTESAMFEWCEDSKAPFFKTISGLVRENQPE